MPFSQTYNVHGTYSDEESNNTSKGIIHRKKQFVWKFWFLQRARRSSMSLIQITFALLFFSNPSNTTQILYRHVRQMGLQRKRNSCYQT